MSKKPTLKTFKACIMAGAASLALSAGGALAQNTETVEFDIEAQELGKALTEFGVQSRTEVLFNGAEVRGLSARQVKGAYSADQAIELLLDDAGIDYRQNADGTLLVGELLIAQVEPAPAPQEESAPEPFRSAEADSEAVSNAGVESDPVVDEEFVQDAIVVTGSNIRGVEGASPVFKFDRDDIDLTGAGTLQDFVRTLPQNFGGGPSEATASLNGSNGGGQNFTAGAGVNLRGLGADSTLVLLNNRRLAPSGGGAFADISMIPLSSISRVEVLTDGASALYGSDAIGGVVNFVLRDDYEGAETRLRAATVTEGDNVEFQAGQTFGVYWESGHGLVSYEYFERAPALEAADREFTAAALGPQSLLPEQERHSLFLSGAQQLGEDVELFGTLFYGLRDSERTDSVPAGASVRTTRFEGDSEQYSAVLGAKIDFGDDWRLEVSGTLAETQEEVVEAVFTSSGIVSGPVRPFDAKTWSYDMIADGALLTIPGGDVRLALGVQYREETSVEDNARNAAAAFGEIFIPIFSEVNQRFGIRSLELTGAVRYEEYSDFGSTVDPKVGIAWAPVEGLKLRSTLGTSFKAPQARELSEANSQTFVWYVPDPSSPDFTGAINFNDPIGNALQVLAFGGNPNLQPERAETFTAGFDFDPATIDGVTLSATYFAIDYTDRISRVTSFFDSLTEPNNAPLVTRNPTPELLSRFLTNGSLSNFTSADPFTATVFTDNRLLNLSKSNTSGVDFNASYEFENNFGVWGASVNGTYLLENEFQLLNTVEFQDELNFVNDPVDLKVRGGLSWRGGGIVASLFANHVGNYKDDRQVPVVDVSSWTTLDLNLQYSPSFTEGVLEGTSFSLNMSNLTDKNPPFVASSLPGQGANFDSINASPLGRFVSLQVTKNW